MKKQKEIVQYESSTVNSSEYDFKNNSLIVTFNSNASYLFEGVSESDYISFRDADSIGKSFNQYIRSYGGQKLETQNV